jgi:hypothetical protein
VLYQVQAGETAGVADAAALAQRLEGAREKQLLRGDAYRTLGRLYGWAGAPEVALDVLAEGVAWDLAPAGGGPLAHYAPWVAWRRALGLDAAGQADAATDALWIYGHWKNRYPQRAESYAQIALIWADVRADPARACAVLDEGLRAAAQPTALLTAARARYACPSP